MDKIRSVRVLQILFNFLAKSQQLKLTALKSVFALASSSTKKHSSAICKFKGYPHVLDNRALFVFITVVLKLLNGNLNYFHHLCNSSYSYYTFCIFIYLRFRQSILIFSFIKSILLIIGSSATSNKSETSLSFKFILVNLKNFSIMLQIYG